MYLYKPTSFYFYENFYEALSNNLFNDLHGLFINYFNVNNITYIVIGGLLLIGSLVCVNVNILTKNSKLLNHNNLFLIEGIVKL